MGPERAQLGSRIRGLGACNGPLLHMSEVSMLLRAEERRKSVDGAASWTPLSVGISDLQAIAIHPLSPNTVYAAGSGVVYKSTNGGTIWAPAKLAGSSRCGLNSTGFPSVCWLTLPFAQSSATFRWCSRSAASLFFQVGLPVEHDCEG